MFPDLKELATRAEQIAGTFTLEMRELRERLLDGHYQPLDGAVSIFESGVRVIPAATALAASLEILRVVPDPGRLGVITSLAICIDRDDAWDTGRGPTLTGDGLVLQVKVGDSPVKGGLGRIKSPFGQWGVGHDVLIPMGSAEIVTVTAYNLGALLGPEVRAQAWGWSWDTRQGPRGQGIGARNADPSGAAIPVRR